MMNCISPNIYIYILKRKLSLSHTHTHTHPRTATHPNKTTIATTKKSNCIVRVYKAMNNNSEKKEDKIRFYNLS